MNAPTATAHERRLMSLILAPVRLACKLFCRMADSRFGKGLLETSCKHPH